MYVCMYLHIHIRYLIQLLDFFLRIFFHSLYISNWFSLSDTQIFRICSPPTPHLLLLSLSLISYPLLFLKNQHTYSSLLIFHLFLSFLFS